MKYKTIELPEMEGKTLGEVKKYVEEKYHNQLAKEEDREEFIKSNRELYNYGTWLFFFGSLLLGSDGRWYVPYVNWNASKWHRRANWLDNTWDSDCRVGLLDDSVALDSCSEINLESLSLALEKIPPVLKININGKEEELIMKSEVEKLIIN